MKEFHPFQLDKVTQMPPVIAVAAGMLLLVIHSRRPERAS
jgi:hypothetical protein